MSCFHHTPFAIDILYLTQKSFYLSGELLTRRGLEPRYEGRGCAEGVARGAIGEGTARHRVPYRASGGEERLRRKKGAGGASYRMLLLFRQLRIFCVVCTLCVHSADFVDAGHMC